MSFVSNFSSYSGRYGGSYRCGACGHTAYANQKIPQCPVCNLPLCGECGKYVFCPGHYSQLTQQDQSWIFQQALKSKQLTRRMKLGIILPIVLLIGFFISIPIVIIATDSPFYVFFMFPVFLVLIISVLSVVIPLSRHQQQMKDEVRLIVQRNWNRLKPSQPAQMPNASLYSTSTQPTHIATPTSIETSVNQSSETRFCVYCGFENPTTHQFCGKCGKALENN